MLDTFNTNVNVGNTVEKVEKQQRVEIELESEKNFCCIKAKAADSQKVITVITVITAIVTVTVIKFRLG